MNMYLLHACIRCKNEICVYTYIYTWICLGARSLDDMLEAKLWLFADSCHLHQPEVVLRPKRMICPRPFGWLQGKLKNRGRRNQILMKFLCGEPETLNPKTYLKPKPKP